MILLSRIFKSTWAPQTDTVKKVINIKYIDSVHVDSKVSQELAYEEYQQIIDRAKNEAEQIKQQANLELDQAREQISQMQDNWEQEKFNLIQQAQAEGYQVGFEQGQNIGYQEVSSLIQQAKETVDASKTDYDKYLQSAETTILNLSLKVANKIINRSIEQDEEYFLSLVQKALREVRKHKEIQLHVHPTHYKRILAEKEELLQLFPAQPNLYIFPDESLSQNGCVIETASGQLDATVDTQLTIIKEKLVELLESE